MCRAGRVDLSAAMAGAGYAVALSDFSEAYLMAVAAARSVRAGIWDSEFAEPAQWRAANPRDEAPPGAVAENVYEAPVGGGVYYRNCSEARAAGAAPLRFGEPGYRPEMDGDRDGIACEPYRR
jgi:hypothetical protein